ncbi:MAG TPA: transporter substrate-binding protein [Pirellulales bacterium]|nr:transporter substrate-binding protein [Pirellulales bacterium]
MTTDSRISELIARWEALNFQGQNVSIEQLCGDCPELADELRKHVAQLAAPSAQVNETLAEDLTAGSTPSAKLPAPPTPGGGRYPNLPGYEIVSELGRGGMGVVYKARQIKLNRPVAIKTIISGAHAGARERARFAAEAESVARLQHPNIVQIYDVGEHDSAPYFSMEFVDGPSLHRRLQGQPVDETTAATVLETIALAIQYAHERGIVHRDLKPANILMAGPEDAPLRDCIPKLTDFGLARQLEEDVRLTQTGVVLGTPCYMAPEQVENPTADIKPAVDIYGLGALLYEMLTGRPPFSAASNFETMRLVVTEDPVRPSLLRPSVPRALERICLKCLAKHPEDRYASAQALADDLALFLDGERPTAENERQSVIRRRSQRRTTPAGTKRNAPWLTRHWQLVTNLLLVAIVSGMVLAGYWHLRRESTESAEADVAASLPAVPPAPPIKVGILHSLTGTMAISEQAVVDTCLLAIDEINEQGGLLGRKIEPIVRDGRSDPPTFAREAERLLAEDKVSVVFGCWTSAARKTVLPIFEKHDSLLVYPVEFEGLEQSPNILYIGPAPNQQIIPAVKWCYAFLDPPARRFFLVGSDYVFPHVANAIIRDELKGMGGEVVGEAYIPLGSSDVAAVIQEIRDAKPDVVLNTVNGDSNIALFRGLFLSGLRPDKLPVLSFSVGEPELRNMQLEDVIGDYAARNYFQTIDYRENQEFLQRFWARYGRQRVVSDAMESGYVGVHLWAKAVQKAQSDDPVKVRQSLRGLEYDGPGGPIFVDPVLLNTHRTTRIGRVRPDGLFDIVASSGSAVAPIIFPKSRTPAEWESLLESLYKKWGNSWSGPRSE